MVGADGHEQEAIGAKFLKSLLGDRVFVQTSYSGSIRKTYAGIGFTYDPGRDAFIPPQPSPSWTLNDACQWVSP